MPWSATEIFHFNSNHWLTASSTLPWIIPRHSNMFHYSHPKQDRNDRTSKIVLNLFHIKSINSIKSYTNPIYFPIFSITLRLWPHIPHLQPLQSVAKGIQHQGAEASRPSHANHGARWERDWHQLFIHFHKTKISAAINWSSIQQLQSFQYSHIYIYISEIYQLWHHQKRDINQIREKPHQSTFIYKKYKII